MAGFLLPKYSVIAVFLLPILLPIFNLIDKLHYGFTVYSKQQKSIVLRINGYGYQFGSLPRNHTSYNISKNLITSRAVNKKIRTAITSTCKKKFLLSIINLIYSFK